MLVRSCISRRSLHLRSFSISLSISRSLTFGDPGSRDACCHMENNMAASGRVWLTLCVVLCVIAGSVTAVFISNLDAACLRCICQGATGCNITAGCVKGYCGPFYISRIYWADADKYVLPEDDPERTGAYHDCAVEYSCAKFIVENYMAKYGKDCNGDGVTDCEDYAMIHYNGGFRCEASLEGTSFHTRFTRCRPPKTTDDELAQGDQPVADPGTDEVQTGGPQDPVDQ